jgi:uncharacterized repeat protein (TIGR01451 family)
MDSETPPGDRPEAATSLGSTGEDGSEPAAVSRNGSEVGGGNSAAATVTVQSAAEYDGWRTFHADAANTGHNPTASSAPAVRLEEAWRIENVSSRLPAVANGRLYTSLRTDDADAGQPLAVDAASGDRVWSVDRPNWDLGPPAVANGRLYAERFFENDLGAARDAVVAVNVGTGAERWTSGLGLGRRIDGPVTVANGTVYALGVVDGLAAADAETGDVRWRAGVDGLPAVANGTVYAGGTAYDATDGTAKWSVAPPAGPVSVADGVVYSMSSGTEGTSSLINVTARDAETGDRLWSTVVDGLTGTTSAATFSSPRLAVAGDRVVLAQNYVTSSDQPRLTAFDAGDGDVAWQRRIGGATGVTNPVIADGTVYVGTVDSGGTFDTSLGTGGLHTFDLTTGRKLDRLGIERGVVGTPVVAGDTVYAVTASENSFEGNLNPGDLIAATGVDEVPPLNAGDAWRQYRGDAGRSGTSGDVVAPTTGVQLAWNRSSFGVGNPAIANGTLYAGSDAYDVWTGDEEGPVQSYPADPAVVDRRPLGVRTVVGGERTPAIVDDTVVRAREVSVGEFGTRDTTEVTATLAATGADVWSTLLPGENATKRPVAVANETVVVTAPEWLFGLNATTGRIEWRAQLADPSVERPVPAVANGTIYHRNDDEEVVALDVRTGERRWTVGRDDLRADNGRIEIDEIDSVVARTGTVYVRGTAADSGNLLAIDATTGSVEWGFNPRPPTESFKPARTSAPPAVTDEVVVAAGPDGGVYGLDSATGKQLWNYTDVRRDWDRLLVARGVVFALVESSGTSDIYALRGIGVDPPRDEPPQVSIEVTPREPSPGESVAFESVVPSARNVTAYEWQFGDGASATGQRVVHRFPDNGSYDIRVRAVTEAGPNSSVSRTVTVRPPNVTGPIILNVSTFPRGPLPDTEGVTKTVRADVFAPNRLQRVEFHLRNDTGAKTYTDADPSDGWAVTIPTDPQDGNATVRVEAVGSLGGRDNETVAFPVYDVSPILETILEAGGEAVGPDKLTRTYKIPPGQPISFGATVPTPAGSVGIEVDELGFGLGATAIFLPPQVEPFGSVSGELGVVVIKSSVDGRIVAVVTPSVGPDGLTFELTSLKGTLDADIGAYRPFGVQTPAGEVTVEAFDGAFLKSDNITWSDPEAFPVPTSAPVFAGKRVRGTATAGPAEVELVGQYGGTSTYPEFDNFSLRGQLIARGTVEGPFAESTFENVLFDESIQLATPNALRIERGPRQLREQRTAIPFPNATFDADGPVPAATGRLTTDGLADESPALTATDDGYLLAWSRQAPDNRVLEGRDLFVRTSDAGTNWTDPVRITDDNRTDLAPAVASGDGTRLLAWQRSTASFVPDDGDYANASPPDADAVYGSMEVAVATATPGDDSGTPADWSSPTVVTNATGAATTPRVAAGTGRYLLAWQVDADGNRSTRDDRSVRYATYDPDGGLGPTTSVADAQLARVAGGADGLRVAYLANASASVATDTDTEAGTGTTTDGTATVVVRNMTAGTQRRIETPAPTDIALSAEAVAWATAAGRNTTVRYATAGGPVERVGAGGVAAVKDVTLTTRPTAGDGGTVDVLTFRGQPLARDPGTNRSRPPAPNAYLRIHQDGNWTTPRSLTPGSRAVRLSAPAVAGRERGVVTVAAAREANRSLLEARNHDLVFVRHTYGTDLNVSASASPTPATPGETVTLNWTVRNDGAVTARNVSVTLTDATGTIRTVAAPAIRPGARAAGSVAFAANRSQVVRVAATSDGIELDAGNDGGSVTLMRPSLSITSVERRPTGASGTHTVTVTNDGPVAAPNLTAIVTVGRRPVAERSVGPLPSNGTRSLTVDAGTIDLANVTRIRVTAAPSAPTTPPGVATRRLAPPAPDLVVTVAGVRTGVNATCVPGAVACVTVGNRGPVTATATVSVRSTDGTATTDVTVPGSEPGSTAFRTVPIDGSELDLSTGQRLSVRARASVPDERPLDNVAGHRVGRLDPFQDDPPVVGSARSTDPDGDGRFEDVDGSGSLTFADVLALFERFDRPPVVTHPRAFDFNGNGRLDFADLVALFQSI